MVFVSISRLASKASKTSSIFYDSLRLTVRAGPGGMGQPKYGGVGGYGGNIVLIAKEDETLEKILKKNPARLIKGQAGENSHAHRLVGENGSDVVIPVPIGITVLTNTGAKLGELNQENDKVVVAKGGIGGNNVTRFTGLKGEERNITLDLKLIADIGLVGFPNAGKSSLLKNISKAQPVIADYPFTTLKPQIGVIAYDDLRQITMADLPGLIEGAHRNRGLGHRFLKHVERTKLLVFMIDINGFRLGPDYPHRTPLETVALLNKELELYGKDVVSKPALLVVNKMDVQGAEEEWKKLKPLLDNYQNEVRSLPEAMQPEQVMEFDEIFPVSVQKDKKSVQQLALKIRSLLDLHATLQSEKYPAQQALVDAQNAEKHRQIHEALKEHQPVALV